MDNPIQGIYQGVLFLSQQDEAKEALEVCQFMYFVCVFIDFIIYCL